MHRNSFRRLEFLVIVEKLFPAMTRGGVAAIFNAAATAAASDAVPLETLAWILCLFDVTQLSAASNASEASRRAATSVPAGKLAEGKGQQDESPRGGKAPLLKPSLREMTFK